jgi:hypothetical protein
MPRILPHAARVMKTENFKLFCKFKKKNSVKTQRTIRKFKFNLHMLIMYLHMQFEPYTRVIQKIHGQCRSPSNHLSENQNQYIIFCKNIHSMNVWIFIAIGQIDLILINFKTNMFYTHGAIITSEKHNVTAIYFTGFQNCLLIFHTKSNAPYPPIKNNVYTYELLV